MTDTTDLKAEHKRLREKTEKSLKDEYKTAAQIATLRAQIKDMRMEIDRLDQKLTTDNVHASVDLAEYAKVDCRQLCDAMYRTVPREIRDMIYGHIHPGFVVPVFAHSSKSWHDVSPACYFHHQSSPRCRRNRKLHAQNHLWQEDSMGKEVLSELLQHYYRSTRFKFGSAYELIPQFQYTNQWPLETVPADFVTNVNIIVACSGMGNHSVHGSLGQSSSPSEFISWSSLDGGETSHQCQCLPTSLRVKVLSGLQTLFGFKPGTRISIEIHSDEIVGGPPQELEFLRDSFIPIIFPTLQRLHQNGYVIEVLLVKEDGWGPPFYRYVVDGSTSTLEAWREKLKEFETIEIKKEAAIEEEQRFKKLREGEDEAGVDGEDSGDEEAGNEVSGWPTSWGEPVADEAFETLADGYPENNAGGWFSAGGWS